MLADALGHHFGRSLRCRNHDWRGTRCGISRKNHLRLAMPCQYPGPPVKRCTEKIGEVKGSQSDLHEGGMVAKMVSDAVREMKSRRPCVRERARWFLFSRESRFAEFCNWIDVDPDALRDGIRRKLHMQNSTAA